MASNTYTLISSVTVGSGGATSISFNSIPATYTDLLIKWSARTDYSGAALRYESISFNSNTSNYSWRTLYGSGSTPDSLNGTTERLSAYNPAATATASTFSNNEMYIPNYAGSNNKSYSTDSVTENNATSAYATLVAGLWSNTSAITSITLTPQYTTTGYQQYSTFYLYGVKSS